MNDVVFLDIETAPIADLPAPPAAITERGLGNIKDPDKRKAKIDANIAGWTEKAALDWRTAQVIAIGVVDMKGKVHSVYQDKAEGSLLHWFWNHADISTKRHIPIVGFNLRNFDLPMLIGRSAVNGITPSRKFNLARFRTDLGVIDWCEILTFWGAFEMTGWSLSQYAEFFRLDAKPFGDGAEVPKRWLEGDYDYVTKHLEADLAMLRELHERFAGAFL